MDNGHIVDAILVGVLIGLVYWQIAEIKRPMLSPLDTENHSAHITEKEYADRMNELRQANEPKERINLEPTVAVDENIDTIDQPTEIQSLSPQLDDNQLGEPWGGPDDAHYEGVQVELNDNAESEPCAPNDSSKPRFTPTPTDTTTLPPVPQAPGPDWPGWEQYSKNL